MGSHNLFIVICRRDVVPRYAGKLVLDRKLVKRGEPLLIAGRGGGVGFKV